METDPGAQSVCIGGYVCRSPPPVCQYNSGVAPAAWSARVMQLLVQGAVENRNRLEKKMARQRCFQFLVSMSISMPMSMFMSICIRAMLK
jgi:hypothetical protein